MADWSSDIFDWFANPGRSNFAQWGVSVLALLMAALAYGNSLATNRRLKQEGRRAKLRGFIEHDGDTKGWYLTIANDGAATARGVSATINGRPLSEFVSRRSREADVIRPGSGVRHLMALTVDKPLPQRAVLRLEWNDDSNSRAHFETSLTL